MWIKKLQYYVYFIGRRVWGLPFYHLKRLIYWSGEMAVYRGIKICDLNEDDTDDERFLEMTKCALDLIETSDPRRFRRVLREIHRIVNSDLLAVASYHRLHRVCRIDFGRMDFKEEPEWALRYYACTIVHEATHGHLYSKFVAYSRTTRERVERLCCLEEKRFLKTLGKAWEAAINVDFDPEGWESAWQDGYFTKVRRLWRSLSQPSEGYKR